MSQATEQVPTAFEAYDEIAAYVSGTVPRSRAITEARDVNWRLVDDYCRRDLHVRRVYMRRIEGEEAEEFFDGECESGWAEVTYRPLNAAQRRYLTPMWKVEPKPALGQA
jgi:hypothetical protein